MEKPENKRNGRPFCEKQLLYLLQENGGSMTRMQLRTTLAEQGYTKYCIYGAFRNCFYKKRIWFEGSGRSKSQVVHLMNSDCS